MKIIGKTLAKLYLALHSMSSSIQAYNRIEIGFDASTEHKHTSWIYIKWNGILLESLCACACACACVRQSILENQNIMENVEWGGTYEACRIPAAVWILVYVTQIYFKYHLMSRTDCLIIIIKVASIQPASMLPHCVQ